MTFRSRVLRPLKRVAVRTVYRNTTEYTMRLDGKKVVYSTVGAPAQFFFNSQLAFGRIPERPVTNRMASHLAQARCFVDVGANLGYYTCLARAFMPEGEIHAFEMDHENFELLQLNLSLNPSSIEAFPNEVAVASEPGEVSYDVLTEASNPVLSIYHHPDDVLSALGLQTGGPVASVTVPAITLDDYFADRSVLPDLVKIDVEGAEYEVLQGMAGLLPEIETMYVEIHPKMLASGGHDAAEVLKLLSEHFRLYEISGHRTQVKSTALEELPEGITLTGNTMVLATRRKA